MKTFFSNSKAGTALRGFLRAFLLCLMAFGLKVTVEQLGAIMTATEAGLQLGAALVPEPTPTP